MPKRNVIIVQVRNPVGKNEPLPVVRVFSDVKMLRLKKAFFEDTLCQVAQVEGVDIKIAIAPVERAVWGKDAIANLRERCPDQPAIQKLEKRTEIIPQAVAPIARRTTENIKRCLADGYKNVVIIGGYIPTVSPDLIREAFHHMHNYPLILGPTIEGGCYLVGVRWDCPEVADLVSIGTDTSYRDAIEALKAADYSWQEIDLCYDVSHQEDLEFVVREINHLRSTGDEETGRRTEEVLAEFISQAAERGDDDESQEF